MPTASALFTRYQHKMLVTPDDCWLWTGRCSSKDHPKVKVDKKDLQAARYFFSECVGPIPTGHVVWHTCRNTLCLNPAHMTVMPKGRCQRMWADRIPRTHSGKGGRSKLTPAETADIVRRNALGEKNVVLAFEYEVSEQTITHVLNLSKANKL